jgi:peptidoglycan/LPS O-acetylase OafA/YrhL
MQSASNSVAAPRLQWPDTVKGMAILWIAYFHGFKEYAGSRFPGPLSGGFWEHSCGAADPGFATSICLGRATWIGFSFLGYHAVGVFILLSGFALSFGQSRKSGAADWRAWYRSRLLRLFPLYWVAHLFYLVSPGYDPIDYRFVLSLLGDRVYPLPEMSYYANPAWWYFGLLLQLYLIFPLLFTALRRFGSMWFLVVCAFVTFLSRYLLLFPLASSVSDSLLGGAVFTCRLFEFGAGMALGAAYAHDAPRTRRLIGSFWACGLGVVLYAAAIHSYAALGSYVFTDALVGVGLGLLMIFVATRIERAPRLQSILATVGMYSYGLYLLHQPYMIWFGIQLSEASLALFVLLAGIAIAALAFVSMHIERRVNLWVTRLIDA